MGISKAEIIWSHVERLKHFEAALYLRWSIIAQIRSRLSSSGNVSLGDPEALRVLARTLESVLLQKLSDDERVFLKGFVMKHVQLCEEVSRAEY